MVRNKLRTLRSGFGHVMPGQDGLVLFAKLTLMFTKLTPCYRQIDQGQ